MRVFALFVAALTLTIGGRADDAARQAEARPMRIELKDKTVVIGFIGGIDDGVYTVFPVGADTPVRVAVEDVQRFSIAPAAGTPPSRVRVLSKAGLTERLLANPAIVALLTRLAEDEQIRRVLNDEALMKDVEAGNYLKLLRSEKLRDLLRNGTVRTIVDDVTGSDDGETKDGND